MDCTGRYSTVPYSKCTTVLLQYYRSTVHYSTTEPIQYSNKYFRQNCDHDTTKALRTLQKRPEFLPRSFSTMGASWLFLASNYDGQVFREVRRHDTRKRSKLASSILQIETTDSWFWMTQLDGEGQLHLKPKTKCEAVCRDMETNLEPGVVGK